jgi:hypothetical protein
MNLPELIASVDQLSREECLALLVTLAARLAALPASSAETSTEASADGANLTIEETAALIRRSTKWLYRHHSRLPFVRKIGPRSYICSKTGLERWLARQQA